MFKKKKKTEIFQKNKIDKRGKIPNMKSIKKYLT